MEQDEAARFTAFYRQHYSLIVTTCFRRLSNFAAAEDAAAEVFRVAWDQFKEEEDPSLAWLYGVVRNVVGNEYRRSKRSRALHDRLEGEAIVAGDDAPEPVLEASGGLKDGEREILFMAYWEDLSGEEIAGILKISKSAVWVRLSRARESLRRQIESHALANGRSDKAGGRQDG